MYISSVVYIGSVVHIGSIEVWCSHRLHDTRVPPVLLYTPVHYIQYYCVWAASTVRPRSVQVLLSISLT